MNKQQSTRKTATILAAIIGMIMFTTAAQADWLSPAFYGDKLDQCAVELRAELHMDGNMVGVTHLRHTVTNIDKVGVWYVFDIHTEMADDTDTLIGQTETHCKAHRWNEQISVEITKRLLAGDTRLASAD
jgi:hypothetical protein